MENMICLDAATVGRGLVGAFAALILIYGLALLIDWREKRRTK